MHERDTNADLVAGTTARELIYEGKLFQYPIGTVKSYQALYIKRADWRVRDEMGRHSADAPIGGSELLNDLPSAEAVRPRFSAQQLAIASLALQWEVECLSQLAVTPARRGAPPDINRFRVALYIHLAHGDVTLVKVCERWERERQAGRRARKQTIELLRPCLKEQCATSTRLDPVQKETLCPLLVEQLLSRVRYRDEESQDG